MIPKMQSSWFAARSYLNQDLRQQDINSASIYQAGSQPFPDFNAQNEALLSEVIADNGEDAELLDDATEIDETSEIDETDEIDEVLNAQYEKLDKLDEEIYASFDHPFINAIVNIAAVAALPATYGSMLANHLAEKYPRELRAGLAFLDACSVITKPFHALQDVKAAEQLTPRRDKFTKPLFRQTRSLHSVEEKDASKESVTTSTQGTTKDKTTKLQFTPKLSKKERCNNPQGAEMPVASRIVGGKAIDNDRNSHLAYILIKHPDGENLHSCSGAFLRSDKIVTAAHCLIGREGMNYLDNIKVQHSLPDRGHPLDEENQHSIVDAILPACAFGENDKLDPQCDITILTLENPAENVTPLEIISHHEYCNLMNGISSKRKSLATVQAQGFGATRSDPNADFSHYDFPANPHSVSLLATRKEGNIIFTRSADKTPRDSCGGDSGGPLLKNGKLVGVISKGPKGCSGQSPAKNVDVGEFENWIEQALDEPAPTQYLAGDRTHLRKNPKICSDFQEETPSMFDLWGYPYKYSFNNACLAEVKVNFYISNDVNDQYAQTEEMILPKNQTKVVESATAKTVQVRYTDGYDTKREDLNIIKNYNTTTNHAI